MTKAIILIIPFIYSLSLFAQDVGLSDNQLNINLLPLTLSYERKIDNNKSFTFSGGLVYATEHRSSTSSNGTSSETNFKTVPFFSSSFRNYYTRKHIKKDLKNNSGNYLGILAIYVLKPSINISNTIVHEQETFYSIGPVWGVQRNYKSGVHLGLSLGLAIQGGKYFKSAIRTTGSFELGFSLFSK
jgi:hypothetical protein